MPNINSILESSASAASTTASASYSGATKLHHSCSRLHYAVASFRPSSFFVLCISLISLIGPNSEQNDLDMYFGKGLVSKPLYEEANKICSFPHVGKLKCCWSRLFDLAHVIRNGHNSHASRTMTHTSRAMTHTSRTMTHTSRTLTHTSRTLTRTRRTMISFRTFPPPPASRLPLCDSATSSLRDSTH